MATALNERLKGQVLYSDGWVVNKSWITHLFHEAGLSMQFQLSPIEQILSEHQMAIWSTVKKKAVIRDLNITRQRASQDA